MKIFKMLNNIDRRIIYVLLSIAVIVPLIFKSDMEITPGPYAEATFNAIKEEFGDSSNPKSNKKILLSFDYGPSTATEVNPMAFAIMKQVLLTGNEVHIMALFDQGLPVSKDIEKQILADKDLLEKFGAEKNIKDKIFTLGYAPGGEAVIKGMLSSIPDLFPDAKERKIKNLCDYNFVVSLSSGTPGLKEWVMYAGDASEAEGGKKVNITTI